MRKESQMCVLGGEDARNMGFHVNHPEGLQRGAAGVGSGEALEGRRLGRAAQIVKPSRVTLFCR